jgi:hypothetical protein
MDFKFSKDSDDQQLEAVPKQQKSQGALAVLLVILIGGFSYLYFFTDLIRPQGGSQPPPAAAPQVVKIPLPPRADDASVPAAPATKKVDLPVAATPQAAPKPVQTAAAVPPAPAVPAAKPAPKVVAPPVKPVDKKVLPAAAPAAKPEQAASAAPVDHAAAGAAKKAAVPPAPLPAPAKGVAAVKPAPVAALKHSAADHEPDTTAEEGRWSVLVGNYVLEETLSADMGRVRKAGFIPVVKSAARKKTHMNRLLFSEFSDRAAARAAFEKLKSHTSDAFILEKGGTYAVYAGSYMLAERVSSEKERLQAEGFPVTLQHSEVSIPAQSLTIGPFHGKKAASAAVKALKGAGIKASLIHY